MMTLAVRYSLCAETMSPTNTDNGIRLSAVTESNGRFAAAYR